MNPATILIADDEPLYLRTTGELLRKAGYTCICVSDASQAMQVMREQSLDLILTDLNMPGNLKLELLRDHAESDSDVPVVVVTGAPSLPTAIESLRLGIADYLLKPVKLEDLLSCVRRVLGKAASTSVQKRAQGTIGSGHHDELSSEIPAFPEIIGNCPQLVDLLRMIDRIAQTEANVLLTGESGTGKEVIAKAIHKHSRRDEGRFQVIDCTAIPEALFESMLFGHKKGSFTGAVNDQEGLLKQCHGGTAFFDELGELPLPLQAKLLRAVQEQTFFPVGSHSPITVDTRFICATNRDLRLEVQAGRFRQDLFYRLGVIHIELPPLRQRGEDVVLLAEHFLKSLQGNNRPIHGFDSDVIDSFLAYSWPGNIRELRNVIERAVALTRGDRVQISALPEAIRGTGMVDHLVRLGETQNAFDSRAISTKPRGEEGGTSKRWSRLEAIQAAERDYLIDLMKRYNGNVSEAARHADVSRQGMHKLLKGHSIRPAEFRSS